MSGAFSRRQLLSCVGVIGIGSLSGCSQLTGTRTELAGIQALNPYFGAERIDIRVEQAGETVIEQTLSVVQEDGAETLPCSWNRDGEEPVIEVRIADDSDWQRLDLAEIDEATVLVQVIVRPETGVRFLVVSPDNDYFVDVCARET